MTVSAAVFDTNVLVSGMLSPHGPPGWLVDALQQGVCRAVVDDRIWDEYSDVLARPAFGFFASDVEILLSRIGHHAIRASVAFEPRRGLALPDSDDVPFLACAAAMDVPLVTVTCGTFRAKQSGRSTS